MEIIARVNPKYFAAINLYASQNDIRYYLNGVCIEPHPEKGVVIVATNGHTLGLIHDPDGFVTERMIVGSISKQLATACASKGTSRIGTKPTALYISKDGAVVDCGDIVEGSINPFRQSVKHMSKIEIIDGLFPDYRKILPKKRERGNVFPCINAKYLSQLNSAVSILVTGRWDSGVELEQRDRTLGVVARINHVELLDLFVSIIMPLHADEPEDILPAWLMPKSYEEQPAE